MTTEELVLTGWIKLSPLNKVEAPLNILLNAGVIRTPSDFYKITSRHLLPFYEITYQDVADIIEAVEKSRDMGMPRALLALLPDVDKATIKKLTDYPRPINDIVTACSDSEYSGTLEARIEDLLQVGVRLDFRDDSIFDATNTPFTGKVVVLSGSLSAEHSVVKSALESFGATVTEKLSEKTDYLLAGTGSGSAVDEAIKKRVEVITELDIEKMMGLTD